MLREYRRNNTDDEPWDGRERRSRQRVRDEGFYDPPQIIVEQPAPQPQQQMVGMKPIIPVSTWLPLLYAITIGIGGYVLSMHDTITKLTYDNDKTQEKMMEAKTETKQIKDSIDKLEIHLNSIESTTMELLRSTNEKRK